MINQEESRQVRMDSCLLKLLSRVMKTKTQYEDQPTIIKNNRKIKNNKMVKAMENTTPIMDHYSIN